MLSLSVVTWVRFLVWLDLGMLIYWFYGRTHSPLVDKRRARRRAPARRSSPTSSRSSGDLALFNGFFMTVLGFMTEFGITTEATAKWHEIGVTPHQADIVRVRGARPRRPRPRHRAGMRRATGERWRPPTPPDAASPRARTAVPSGGGPPAPPPHTVPPPLAREPRDAWSPGRQHPDIPRWWVHPHRLAALLLATVLAGGTLGYILIEGWRAWDAVYMTVITVTTVGYREVHPLSRAGEVFTVVLLIGGVGTALLHGHARSSRAWSKAGSITGGRAAAGKRMIDELTGHFIVCGYGRIGRIDRRRVPPPGRAALRRATATRSGCTQSSRRGASRLPPTPAPRSRCGAWASTRARALIAAVGTDAENVYIDPECPPAAARPLHHRPRRDRRRAAEDRTGRRDRVISPYQTRRASHRADRTAPGRGGFRAAGHQFARRSSSRWSRSGWRRRRPRRPEPDHRQPPPALRRDRRRHPAARTDAWNSTRRRTCPCGPTTSSLVLGRPEDLKPLEPPRTSRVGAAGSIRGPDPMSARLLDGTASRPRFARSSRPRVAAFTGATGGPPGLGIVLVGDDPASHVYVRNKIRSGMDVGFTRRSGALAGVRLARRRARRGAASQPERGPRRHPRAVTAAARLG